MNRAWSPILTGQKGMMQTANSEFGGIANISVLQNRRKHKDYG